MDGHPSTTEQNQGTEMMPLGSVRSDEDQINTATTDAETDGGRRRSEGRKKSSTWGILFRTAKNEQGPSRTRPKATSSDSVSEAESSQAEDAAKLGRSDSETSMSPGEAEIHERKKNKEKKPKWRIAQNPLFKSKKEAKEVVPLYWWCYEAVLSFLWPPFNYFRLHLLYICFLSLIGGIVIYCSQLGLSSELTFLDALFHAVSSTTQTGLFPTNFSQFSRLGQVIVAALIFLGNGVLLTMAPVIVRLYYFRKYYKQAKQKRAHKADEYYALWHLVFIIPLYYCFFVGGAWIIMGSFMAGDPAAQDIIDKNDNNPVWWGLFHAISAFGNCGYSTFADNMVQWNTYPVPLVVMSILIFTGNTAFPLIMRFIIEALYRNPLLKRFKHVYRYMLDHPRRCYTHLFPAAETRWLLLVLLSLNSIQFLFEIMLDWHSGAYTGLNAGQKLMNMYFQSVAVRTSGFNSVDITQLSAANLLLITAMMYIAASPVTITLRYTGKTDESIEASGRVMKTTNTVGSQAQNVFVRHVFLLFIGLLFICMIEEVPLKVDPNYSIFKIIFEIASAYGTVGLTLGYGTRPYSFCGVWSGGSKFVLLLIMILGKHRNLPESIDTAITAPSDAALFEDEDDSDIEVLSDDDIVVDDDDPEADDQHKSKGTHSLDVESG